MNLLLDDVATSSPISAIDRAELRPLEEGETKPLATEAAARDRRQHLMVTSVVLCLPETSATLTELDRDRDPCYSHAAHAQTWFELTRLTRHQWELEAL